MPLSDGVSSSPPGPSTSSGDAIAYYKAQYESLESELADFQASSKELEAELEKDIEASEKRERQLKEKADNLVYEVDEWKTKYKQSKSEGNAAQNTLQKEITTLRDTNRTLHMRLRDIEVANDDYERQQRNTESSLEDLESKYSMAIERSVMLEEEVKVGEQEREALRIDAQRLRDELSDLRIEAEITKGKMKKVEANMDHRRKLSPLEPVPLSASPRSELSPTTTDSSPSLDTPEGKTASSPGLSDTHTPPSPPTSEKSTSATKAFKTPTIPKMKMSITSNSNTPRPSKYSLRPPNHSRSPSASVTSGRSTPSTNFRQSMSGPSTVSQRQAGLPQSNSIYHLHNLQGKMQRLTERVHTAKSKLPAPVNTPPRSSPRAGPTLASNIPATVTVRSSRKRGNGSTINGPDSLPDTTQDDKPPSMGTPSIQPKASRQSLTMPPPTATPTRPATEKSSYPFARPSSRASASTATASRRTPASAHPSPRQNAPLHSYQPGHGHSRPGSRASASLSTSSSTRAPLRHRQSQHFAPNASTDRVRPKSNLSNYGGLDGAMDDEDEPAVWGDGQDGPDVATPTPRRTTFGRVSDVGVSGIPTPGNGTATAKRLSVSRLPAGSSSGRMSFGALAAGGAGAEHARPSSSRSNKSALGGVGEHRDDDDDETF